MGGGESPAISTVALKKKMVSSQTAEVGRADIYFVSSGSKGDRSFFGGSRGGPLLQEINLTTIRK